MTLRTLSIALILALGPLSGCGSSDPTSSGAEEAAAPDEGAPAAKAPGTAAPDPRMVGEESTLPEDVPVMDGLNPEHPPLLAAGVTRAAYRSDAPVDSVLAFYRKALADAGWEIGRDELAGQNGLMAAQKGDRQVSIVMSGAEGGTRMLLLHTGS